MKVLVFGRGNLGHSVVSFCKQNNISYHLISRSLSEFSPDFQNEYDADLVINTVGGDFFDDPSVLWSLNITDNIALLNMYPERPIITFSCYFALEPWRSPYASIKRSLESLTNAYSNLFVIRVSSLYGAIKPCYPDLVRGYPKVFSNAPVQPTPTDWLAEKIFHSSLINQVFTLAPENSTTFAGWAQKILQRDVQIGNALRYEPQKILQSWCTEKWETLWDCYGS